MAEFKGDWQSLVGFEVGEEGAEAIGGGREVRWELEEKQAEFAGLPDGLKCGYELGDICFAVLEALEVGDALR